MIKPKRVNAGNEDLIPSTSAPTTISQIPRSAYNKKPIPDTRSKFRHYYPIINIPFRLIKLHDLVAFLGKAQLLKRVIFVPGQALIRVLKSPAPNLQRTSTSLHPQIMVPTPWIQVHHSWIFFFGTDDRVHEMHASIRYCRAWSLASAFSMSFCL